MNAHVLSFANREADREAAALKESSGSIAGDGDDPLIEIGRQLAQLEARQEVIEELQGPPRRGKPQDVYLQSEMEDNLDKVEGLIGGFTALTARSLEGALIQIGVVNRLLSTITDFDVDRKTTLEICEQMQRLVYSAARFLKTLPLRHPPSEISLDCTLPIYLDPWASYEEKRAFVDGKHPEHASLGASDDQIFRLAQELRKATEDYQVAPEDDEHEALFLARNGAALRGLAQTTPRTAGGAIRVLQVAKDLVGEPDTDGSDTACAEAIVANVIRFLQSRAA